MGSPAPRPDLALGAQGKRRHCNSLRTKAPAFLQRPPRCGTRQRKTALHRRCHHSVDEKRPPLAAAQTEANVNSIGARTIQR